MGVSENITAAILILIISIAGALVYSSYSVKKKASADTMYDTLFLKQKMSDTLDTALMVTEPNTGRQFGDLLASTVYYRTEIVNISGRQVNITSQFEDLLSNLTGSKDHYFEVFPKITNIRLVFLGVNEPRMLPIYAVLERDLDNLILELENSHKGVDITGEAVILNGQDICDEISIDCIAFTEQQIYNNNLSNEDELIKYMNGFFRPADGGAGDWETAMSYKMITTSNRDMSQMEVILPLADALPGSTDTNKCNSAYADSIVSRDNLIMMSRNFVVDPILIDNGDAGYCQQDTILFSERLINNTKGSISRYNLNFLGDVSKVIQKNIDSIAVKGGTKRDATNIVLQRDIQMPNGEITIIRFQVYT